MADDIDNDGGTQDGDQSGTDGKQEPQGTVYTKEELDTLILGAQKEAVTKTWGEMQSRSDKAIQAAKTETTTAQQQLTNLKRANIDALPPEQKQAAMLEEVYAKMNAAPEVKPQDGAPDPQTQTQGDPSTFQQTPTAPSNTQDKAREAVGKILQEKGLDPSKIEYGDGKDEANDLRTFIDSVMKQVKPEQDDPPQNKNTYDNSRGTGGSVDILKVDPVELMKRGYAKGGWRKRGGDI